ncbi:MAG: LysR family transcriptional regulator [Mesorhizobium sp.]
MRYFQIVADSGSYSRGAELLQISQPAVSRAVNLLEEELGRPLFNRNGHGVSLTDSGRILLERSHQILRQVEQTVAEIRRGETGPSGTVAIALPPAAGFFIAPALAQAVANQYPGVSLRFVGGVNGDVHDWLARGAVDMACLYDPAPQRGFESRPLLREQVFLVRRPDASGAFAGEVGLDRLMAMPLILPGASDPTRRLLDAWAIQHGGRLDPRLESDDQTMTHSLIAQGLAAGLSTRGAFADDIARGALEAIATSPVIHWTLKIVTNQRAARSELTDIVSKVMVDVIEDLRTSGVWETDPV